MNSKFDIKTIAILILLGVCILFFGMWFFSGSDYKKKTKELEDQNKKIELVRDSLENVNKKLKSDYDIKQKDIDERDNRIKEIEASLLKTKGDLIVANKKVDQSQKDLAATKKKIEDLKSNPIKRDDDALINSLKEKLGK